MNKRIKELVEQARNYALDEKRIYERIYNTEQSMEEYRDVYNEKFAELIVKECVNRIEQNRSSGENTDSWTITRDMAFHQMKEDLKKHFGVEE